MSRFAAAVLLVAAGLGIGLFLGFNTEARAAVESNWERASTSIARVQTDAGLDVNIGQTATEQPDSAQTSSSPSESPLKPLAQLLDDLWQATRQLWFSLLGRLELSI